MTETGPITFSLNGQKPLYHLLGTATRYSGWTARVTTALEYFQIPYTATYIRMSFVKDHSPSGLIPLLTPLTLSTTQKVQINDSLSILEYLAESHPDLHLWPKDAILRALARSAVAEMHSGFSELRSVYHSTYVGKYTGDVPVSEKARKEVERLLAIWGSAREFMREYLGESEDGGWLFGTFSIADVFFWPVLWRLRSYNLPLDTASPQALEWMKKMWEEPKLKELGKDYFKQVENPETSLPQYDDVFKGNASVTFGTFEEDWVFEGKSG